MSLSTQDLQRLIELIESNPELRSALRSALWRSEEFVEWLREHLPKLLQEDQRFGAEVVGVLAQTLSPRSELVRVLEELQALREDFTRRFEAIDRRFEAVDRRFEALQQEMDRRFEALQREMDRRFEALQREMDERFALQSAQIRHLEQRVDQITVGMGSLGHRFGIGFEEAVRRIVEEFAGIGPLKAERLVLKDDAGEVFGTPGAEIEFDAFIHDGRQFLVEVKAYADVEDVYLFRKKVSFALKHLREDVEPLLVAPFARARTLEVAKQLGIRVIGRGKTRRRR